MPRANRFFLADTVWHITHRCHNRAFLLKFEKDRQRWKYWLFQAKKRYGLTFLNYIATSNHVHLLVLATNCHSVSRGLQLIAGRTAQEYNQRKRRKGAFWEDRFFATAICTDEHLARCLVYIDLNMVRAGAVAHPSRWEVSGYNEIQNPPQRYRIIDQAALCQLFNYSSWNDFTIQHERWVKSCLENNEIQRDAIWTSPIAVGPESFVSGIKTRLCSKAYHRGEERHSHGTYMLKDANA